jgi:hypothetical protein
VSETQRISLDDDPAMDAAYDYLAGKPDPCGKFSAAVYCAPEVLAEHARIAPIFALAERVKAIEDIITSLQAEADENEAVENRRSAVARVFGPDHPGAKSAASSGAKSTGWSANQMKGDRG